LTAGQCYDIEERLTRQTALTQTRDAVLSALAKDYAALKVADYSDQYEQQLSFENFVVDATWRGVDQLWAGVRYAYGSRAAGLDDWLLALLERPAAFETAPGGWTVPKWDHRHVYRTCTQTGLWPQPINTLARPGNNPWWFLLHTRSGTDNDVDGYSDICTIYHNTSFVQMLPEVVVLAENPTVLTLDKLGRLHNETGPALAFADGHHQFAWHGLTVPATAITDPVDLGVIVRERNIEVRRCLIERMGWDEFIGKAQLVPVGPAVPDPGNAPHTLQLYDLGHLFESSNRLPDSARLLLCTNGSAERDGTRRRYGLFVPGRHTDPIAAASELYGVSAATYRRMQIRT
jgi:uncharacterized protein DUF6745